MHCLHGYNVNKDVHRSCWYDPGLLAHYVRFTTSVKNNRDAICSEFTVEVSGLGTRRASIYWKRMASAVIAITVGS